MKCPACKTTDLLMTERRSIEVDYCPNCRGVWLDRGELDKLIAQDTAETGLRSAASASRHDHREHDRAYDSDRRYEDHRSGYRTQKKKRSIFDVFDFD
ncbi:MULTISPECIES: TFIIB-type zinc ribbon-containing protein [Paraburkholderia]|uniref:TFIIB-type zinc ribbon-containing protein n=1 Tax=Paraburkholderia TaxID=1822464 RepID=UPI000B4012DA|nr:MULTISPECIES: zf-TFIIB domain-containing protein [Paraburkholderia]MDR7009477.1 Zn-finger nucleic acid-binding protein [Paraburkholderia strydomiana]